MLCLGERAVYAQAAPVDYWIPGWPMGFGGDSTAGQSPDTYGNFPSFDFRDVEAAAFPMRATIFRTAFLSAANAAAWA